MGKWAETSLYVSKALQISVQFSNRRSSFADPIFHTNGQVSVLSKHKAKVMCEFLLIEIMWLWGKFCDPEAISHQFFQANSFRNFLGLFQYFWTILSGY